MPTHAADLLVHGANLLMLISYSVRDILWLRWFAVASAVTVIPYYLVQPTILWPPVFWSSVFLVVNVFQIARIYVERRPVVFSADEGRLYAFGFDRLRPREFIALVSAGEWKDACAGERLLTEGDRRTPSASPSRARSRWRPAARWSALCRPATSSAARSP